MTLIQIHLLMLALGLLACLFVAGSAKTKKSKQGTTGKSSKPWGLALLAGIIVAASPLSRFWRSSADMLELLTQSLLVAAIGLLALLLFALLRRPKRRATRESGKQQNKELLPAVAGVASLAPIVIDAERRDHTSIETNQADELNAHSSSVTVDKSKPTNTEASISVAEELHIADVADDLKSADAVNVAENLNNSDAVNELQMPDALDVQEGLNGTHVDTAKEGLNLQNSVNMSDTLNLVEHELPDIQNSAFSMETDEQQEEFDLSDTEEIYSQLREQRTEIELPDVNDWTADISTDDDIILDENLLLKDDLPNIEATNANSDTSVIRLSALEQEQIEDAEMIEVDDDTQDQSLQFESDLTGDYARPMASIQEATPDTLNEALLLAKQSATELHQQVEELESGLAQLGAMQTSISEEQTANQTLQAESNKEKDKLIDAEDKARNAAEAVIAVQSHLIEKSKKQHEVINTLLHQERLRFAAQQAEVERTREIARKATNLARKAANAQIAIKEVARREQAARVKSQEAMRKAVLIARNAISALAKEEQKRGITRH